MAAMECWGLECTPAPHKVNYVMSARIHELRLYNSSNFAIQYITTKFLSKNVLIQTKKFCQILTSLTIPKERCITFQGRCKNLRGGAHRPPPPPSESGHVVYYQSQGGQGSYRSPYLGWIARAKLVLASFF
jgi:hypothetical protein